MLLLGDERRDLFDELAVLVVALDGLQQASDALFKVVVVDDPLLRPDEEARQGEQRKEVDHRKR